MPDYLKPQSEKSDKTDNGQTLHDEQHLRFNPLSKSIIQSLPIGIVTFDPALKIIDANAQAARLIELGDYIDKSLARGTNNPGHPTLDWAGQLKSTLSTGKTQNFETVRYTSNTRTKLLRIVCAPLKNVERKRTVGGTLIVEDITDKVNIQRKLANIEKLATVGKLASKVAHELNNPMDGILRYINLTLRIIEQENLEKPKEYLAQCRQGLMRMVHIVSELLEFSRTTYASFEYARLEQIIDDAVKTMHSAAETPNVRISRNYTREIPQIRGGNLFQVFCNLTKNALEAMPYGGELNISTRMTPDDTAVIEFRDTGTGFAPENAEAIFEPFFTTKDKGKGTGLGLAICRDIIERHHGRITAENAPGGGSIFTVYLPATGEIS
jgi:signal transduction histidine kinase